MTWSFYENSGTANLVGTQTTLLGPTALTDIPGCSLVLTPGVWIVSGVFHVRIWQLGTAYSKMLFSFQLADAANATILGQYQAGSIDAGAEQRSDGTHSFTTFVNTAVNYTVKLRGACSMAVGTNFGGGFRWDSGDGGPSTITAIKVG